MREVNARRKRTSWIKLQREGGKRRAILKSHQATQAKVSISELVPWESFVASRLCGRKCLPVQKVIISPAPREGGKGEGKKRRKKSIIVRKC